MDWTVAEGASVTRRRAVGVGPALWVRWGPVDLKVLAEVQDNQDLKERKATSD